MNAQSKDKTEWHHPIATALLKSYHNELGILDIIELEVESLLSSLKKNHPKIFSQGEPCVPIEKIAQALNVDLSTSKHSRSLGNTRSVGSKIHVSINTEIQHYFRQRFTLAHELGHICLSQMAGPFTYQELAQTKDSHYEEEALCDLFASAILMPKPAIKQYLERVTEISSSTINGIASDFKVSKSAVLRRLAWVKKSLLLFWSEIKNPLTQGSEKTERITFVYPNLHQLSNYFIPLYCTANDVRFNPNVIIKSLEQETSISGNVQIKDLGSLPAGNYYVHNIFFRRWSKDTTYFEGIKKTQWLYDMSTLIELNPST